MKELTPEMLVERMVWSFPSSMSNNKCRIISKHVLRIVLKAIEDGDVINTYHLYSPTEGLHTTERMLKPQFKAWMEGDRK